MCFSFPVLQIPVIPSALKQFKKLLKKLRERGESKAEEKQEEAIVVTTAGGEVEEVTNDVSVRIILLLGHCILFGKDYKAEVFSFFFSLFVISHSHVIFVQDEIQSDDDASTNKSATTKSADNTKHGSKARDEEMKARV